jgi:hypothetical protein
VSYHDYASTDTQCLIEELEKQNDKTVEALKDVRTQLVEVTRAIYVLAAVQSHCPPAGTDDAIDYERALAQTVRIMGGAGLLATRQVATKREVSDGD